MKETFMKPDKTVDCSREFSILSFLNQQSCVTFGLTLINEDLFGDEGNKFSVPHKFL